MFSGHTKLHNSIHKSYNNEIKFNLEIFKFTNHIIGKNYDFHIMFSRRYWSDATIDETSLDNSPSSPMAVFNIHVLLLCSGSIKNLCETTSGPFRHHLVLMLISFPHHLQAVWGHSGNNPGSFWNHSGKILKSLRDNLGSS